MKLNPFIQRINNWLLYIIFTTIVSAIVVYSVYLVDELRQRETEKIQVVGKAMRIQQSKQLDPDIQDLIFSIFTENERMPMIVTDENRNPILGEGTYKNIPEHIVSNPSALKDLVDKMGKTYKPLELDLGGGHKQLVFYDNSVLLNNLQFYPYFLGLFILAYLIFSAWFLRTLKKKDEGYVWAGLAKETAHQIGTPLSSMIGWIEIMRMENPNSEGVNEFEKDIERLRTISERFSKIGSIPELNDMNLSETVRENFNYLKNRISTKVNFSLTMPEQDILIPHNRILMSWVLENLVKNAVDAMKGVGNLSIDVTMRSKVIQIEVKDTGCGMNGHQARSAFRAGYSTKKRGWGLGLSLARRVIKEYHKGDIKIAQTEVAKGTTFRINLRK